MLIGCRPAAGANGGLEHRIDLHRHHQAAPELGRMVENELLTDDPGRPVLWCRGPLQLMFGLASAYSRAPGLATGEDRDVQRARLDLGRRGVDEALRALPTHGGVGGLDRRQAELLSDEIGRVAVLPGQQVDDPQRLRIWNRTQSRIGRCVADGRAHQQARIQRLVQIVGVLHRLSNADDHGCVGIECHCAYNLNPNCVAPDVLSESRETKFGGGVVVVDSADAANRHRL